MSFAFVKRHNVRRTDDYWFEIDEYKDAGGKQFLLVHLQFFNWSVAVLKQVIREFNTFRKIVRAPLFASPLVPDGKWVRFITMMGYRYLQDIVCDDGQTRPLYIHTT